MNYEDIESSPTRPKWRSPSAIAAGALILGLLLGSLGTLGIVAIADKSSDSPSGNQASSSSSEYEDVADSEEDEGFEAPSYEPTTDDFTIEISVKEQKCYGSAGCNVTLGMVPSYEGTQVPTDDFEVTYEITGVEDGPLIQTFAISDGQMSFTDEITAQTAKASATVEAKITRVAAAL